MLNIYKVERTLIQLALVVCHWHSVSVCLLPSAGWCVCVCMCVFACVCVSEWQRRQHRQHNEQFDEWHTNNCEPRRHSKLN